MAMVKIDSGPVAATDLLRDVPRDKWRTLMIARKHFMDTRLSFDCRCLVKFVKDAEEMYEPLGFASVDDMVRNGYDLEPEEVRIAVDWLNINEPDEPISHPLVLKLAAREIGIPGGKPGPGRGHKTGSDTTRLGRGATYLLARLDRDGFTALAAEVRAGTMSANAAAIEAGIRKPPRPRLTHCPHCGGEL